MTLILPLPPGLIGSLGNSGRVQPQEAEASMMISGSEPVLVNSNVWLTEPSASRIVPKSKLFSANSMRAPSLSSAIALTGINAKIIVTKMTDPGWVFLIKNCKGIIAQQGSLLSHTAIISRELNKPAIVNVKNVLQLVTTGEKVKINGLTGEIEKLL